MEFVVGSDSVFGILEYKFRERSGGKERKSTSLKTEIVEPACAS